MLIYDHVQGVNDLGEIQNLRMHNVASLGSPSSSSNGLVRYLTTNNTLHLHVGASVWKQFKLAGDALTDMALTQNNILVGNVSNLATPVAKTSVPLSDWGAATANLALGGNKITGSGTVTSADADNTLATVGYVNAVAQGLDAKGSCLIASNAALPSCTYSTVSLTLTATANGAMTATTIDSGASGSTLAVGSRVLIKNQATSEHNGLYAVQSLGSAGAPWILVRTNDTDTNLELESAFTFVEEGTSANTGWVQTSDTYDITNPSTNSITWSQFSGAGSYLAGRGLILSGNTFHFAKTGAYANGDMFYGTTSGSGDSATSKLEVLAIATSGKVLQSNGTNPTWSTAGFPTGSAANQALLRGDGTNWTSLSVVSNSVLVSTSGTVGWSTSLPSGTSLAGNTIYSATGTDVALADGGTGASLTAASGAIVYSTGSAMAFSSVSTSGYFLRSGGTGAPTWLNLFGSANTWTAENNYHAATGVALVSTRFTSDTYNRVELRPDGLFFGLGSGAAPTLSLYATSSSELVSEFNLRLNNVGATPGVLYLADADASASVGLTAPSVVASSKTWTLPATDVTNGYWKSNGSGVLSLATITAAEIGSPATLTPANDTNVTLAVSVGACLVAASTLTLGWTGTLSVARGGTGQGSNLTQYGIVYGSSTTAMATTAAPTATGQVLRGNTAGAPTWTGYTLPATLGGSNRLLLSSSSTVLAELSPTADRVLVTNGSSVVSWGGVLNVARNTAGGIARKWSNQVVGDGSNSYISVTHNLNSRDIQVSIRQSNSGDTGSQEIGYQKVTVEDANTIRFYFNAVQTASNYYVVTVIG